MINLKGRLKKLEKETSSKQSKLEKLLNLAGNSKGNDSEDLLTELQHLTDNEIIEILRRSSAHTGITNLNEAIEDLDKDIQQGTINLDERSEWIELLTEVFPEQKGEDND